MRENCTYGLTRGRAYPTRGAPLYSTSIDIVVVGLAFDVRRICRAEGFFVIGARNLI